tara:strand:- start:8756 stop:9919 length:1164 start_codon:yes stop_codon:yes gene_type:complete
MSDDIMNKLTGEIKDFVAKSNEEIEAHGKLGAKNADELKALNEKVEELSANALAAEQAIAAQGERVQADNLSKMSIGNRVVNSEEYKAFQNGGERTRLEIQNADTVSAPADNSDLTSFVTPQRLAGVVGSSFQRVDVLDFISQANTQSNLIEYTTQTTETDNVDTVAEGSAMTASDYQFTLQQAPVQTIGSFLVVSKQTINDAPAVASYIDNRLAYNVRRELESQVITGSGTSPDLSGISSNSTAYTAVAADNDLFFERIRQQITVLQEAGYSPTAIFVAPATLQALDLQSDTAGIFVASDPRMFNLPMAWGIPIVQSTNVPANVAIVGDWQMASTLFMREGTVVEMFEADASNVRSNLVTIRGTTRASYATYDTSAISYGDILTDA